MSRRLDPDRPRSVLVSAVLVGLVAGLAAAALLTVIGEPSIEQAIAIEEAAAEEAATGSAGGGATGEHEPELVGRDVQKGVGLFAAYGVTGAAFGLLLAVAWWSLRGARPDPFHRALVAGAVLAGALTLGPWFKYPPNPPAVGDPDTLAQRQLLYVLVVALTAVVGFGAASLSTRLRRRGWSDARRTVVVAAAVAAPLALAFAVLPGAPDEITVPADLLWRFRLASLAGNVLLWTVLTLGFGLLAAEASRHREAAPAGNTGAGAPVSTRSP